jgi:hypothetical protein
VEYFDSFGNSLEYYGLGHLKKGLNIRYYKRALQHEKSFVCGYYCLYFLFMKSRHHSLTEIYSNFTRDKIENDCLVFKFTKKVFDTCHFHMTITNCTKYG